MVLAAQVMDGRAPAAVAVEAEAAVAAPAAVAAIPVAVAEDRPATHLDTVVLAPVPKLYCHQRFALMMYSLLFLLLSFYRCQLLTSKFLISCPNVVVGLGLWMCPPSFRPSSLDLFFSPRFLSIWFLPLSVILVFFFLFFSFLQNYNLCCD